MFGKDNRHKDGLQSSCKECETKRTQSYYEDHPEKRQLSLRDYAQRNPDKVRESQRRWKKENPDKVYAKNQRYLTKLNLANCEISQRTLNAWAAQVKALNPRCDWCLCVDDLEAHHIKPKALYPELALDLTNGQTLCTKHHDEIHSTKF